MNLKAITLVLLCLTSLESMAEDLGKTLCMPDEDVYFSCELDNGKTVSTCAKGNLSPTTGYVQYRYGTHENIELKYPSKKVPPRKFFFITNATEGSAVQANLKFYIGKYTYIMHQSFVSGLYVLENGNLILNSSCTPGGYAFISFEADKGIISKPKSREDFH